MPVIVMTRELGTEIKPLAEQLAKRYGLTLAYRDLGARPDEAARLAPREPGLAPDALIDHLAQLGARHALEDLAALYELALGNRALILGWTPVQALRFVPHVLRVRVRATMALRVERLAQLMGGADKTAALRRILAFDARDSERLRCLFGIADREDASSYHLVADVGRHGAAACADQIAAALESREQSVRVSTRRELARLLGRIERASRAPAEASWSASPERQSARLAVRHAHLRLISVRN